MVGGVVSANMTPGSALFSSCDEAKVTNSTNTGTTDNIGDRVNDSQVAVVVKGVSLAKAQATYNNTTLYPIRIKLLV